MKKLFTPTFIKTIFSSFTTLFLIFSWVSLNQLYATPPAWSTSFPYVKFGASSIDIHVASNQTGKVYYAIYNYEPISLTPSLLKEHAINGKEGVVGKGIVNITTINKDVVSIIQKLKDNTTYYTCLIAENQNGELMLQKDLKTLKSTLHVRHSKHQYLSKEVSGYQIGYNAYFPEEYYRSSDKNYPLLVFLHGISEKGSGTERLDVVKKYGPPLIIDQGNELPFIVISPQTPWGWNNNDRPGALVEEIIDQIKLRYNVDPSRVYVTGLSMGGNGVYGYFQNYPEKVAAAIPMAGYCDVINVCEYKEVPFWAFHNTDDPTIGVGNDISMVEAFNKCNPPTPAKLTLSPGSSHDCWTKPYANLKSGPDNIYEWALRHVKGNLPEDGSNKSPHVFAGHNVQASSSSKSVTLKSKAYDTDGKIVSYRWTQVSGPSAFLTDQNTANLVVSNLKQAKYKFRVTVQDDGDRTTFDEVTLEVADNILAAENGNESDLLHTGVALSPNPVKDIIYLKSEVAIPENATISIVDLNGKVVSEDKLIAPENGEVSVNLSSLMLSNGIYYLQLKTSSAIKTFKFFKE